jgi:hypothetical protein
VFVVVVVVVGVREYVWVGWRRKVMAGGRGFIKGGSKGRVGAFQTSKGRVGAFQMDGERPRRKKLLLCGLQQPGTH